MFLELKSIGLEVWGQNLYSTSRCDVDVDLSTTSVQTEILKNLFFHLSSSALFFCVYEHAKVKLLLCLKEPLEVNPYELCSDDQR